MAKIEDVSANPAELVWPQDTAGFLNKLKPELTRAVGRINGKEEKLQAFLATLRMAAGHAKARYRNQKAENDRQVELMMIDEMHANYLAEHPNTEKPDEEALAEDEEKLAEDQRTAKE